MFYNGFAVDDIWRTHKLRLHEKGYIGIDMRSGHGTTRRTYVHILVAENFISPKPFPGACVRHLDGCPSNNHVDNLKWGTYKENESDKMLHGTWGRRGGGKLTREGVLAIRNRAELGESQVSLASEYGVSRPTITRIVNRTIWNTNMMVNV